jgi:alpha-L-fucosidase
MRSIFLALAAALAVSALLSPAATAAPAAPAASVAPAEPAVDESAMPWLKARPEAMQRWDDLTFGLFMHWDPSSLLGVEISWHKQSRVDVAGEGDIPDEIYNNLYRSFNPAQFDARAFVQVAKDAGMRYIVLTSKHHGGFCMFDSALTDFDIMSTAFKRDIVKELAEATREAGLAFGFYYSQPDWHHPDFVRKDFDAYRPYLFGQLRELCTNYGRIDIIFFDGLFYGEKEYHSRELFKMIRELQPDVVINNRCGLPADYDTPEQVVGAFQNTRPWESCMTLGTSWSWKTYDTFKSPADCIRILVQTVGGDGNLLLNVGPMPTGIIEPRQAAILKQIGDWLRVNGESVYALEGGPYKPSAWGACTSKDRTLYLHILSWFDAPEFFPALPARIASVTRLDGRPVAFTQDERGVRFEVPETERDPLNTILKVTLAPDGPAAAAIAPILVPTRSLARFQKVTASHNSDTAALVVDDDPATEWLSPSRQCWIEVDLGADRRFDRVDIREEGHEWEPRTSDFELLIRAEGTAPDAWTTLDKGNKIGHTYSKSFAPVTARFVRLKINDAGRLPHFSEIQVYTHP